VREKIFEELKMLCFFGEKKVKKQLKKLPKYFFDGRYWKKVMKDQQPLMENEKEYKKKSGFKYEVIEYLKPE